MTATYAVNTAKYSDAVSGSQWQLRLRVVVRRHLERIVVKSDDQLSRCVSLRRLVGCVLIHAVAPSLVATTGCVGRDIKHQLTQLVDILL